MSIKQNDFWYSKQIVKYITQFMAIFQGLQVELGKINSRDEALIEVPIMYGHFDRVVAALLADNTQNKPLRLPLMSAYIAGISLAQDRARGTGTERRTTYVPSGGLIPDDMKVVYQYMPTPYDLSMELNIYASNTNQHLQILEQILTIFNPDLSIQTSDAIFDWTRLTTVLLTDVSLDTNFPIGTDKRVIQSKLTFKIPIELSAPADVRKNFVEHIRIRLGILNSIPDNNYDILDEFDGLGIPYDLIATDKDLPFE